MDDLSLLHDVWSPSWETGMSGLESSGAWAGMTQRLGSAGTDNPKHLHWFLHVDWASSQHGGLRVVEHFTWLLTLSLLSPNLRSHTESPLLYSISQSSPKPSEIQEEGHGACGHRHRPLLQRTSVRQSAAMFQNHQSMTSTR